MAFVDDKFGLFSNQSVSLQYAVKFKLGDGLIDVGVNLAYLSQTIGSTDSLGKVHIVESDYHQMSNDLLIPQQPVHDAAVDFGLGAFYAWKKYYVGFSVLHLFEPSFSMDENITTFISRAAYLNAGCEIPFTNVRYVFQPSMLIKTDFISYQTDFNFRVEKDDKYWLGLGWRYQDAVIFMGGLNLSNGLSVGYSYDLSTNKLISYSYGSHELMLRYNVNLVKNKLNKYKSVRIL
jgi:type IX secretion system PorP/SprF family membrane protein